jgi:hypothetical protein
MKRRATPMGEVDGRTDGRKIGRAGGDRGNEDARNKTPQRTR